jgi:hypothetical protein
MKTRSVVALTALGGLALTLAFGWGVGAAGLIVAYVAWMFIRDAANRRRYGRTHR